MSRYVFDIESDGLLESVTKLHCLVIHNLDTGETESYSPATGFAVGLAKLEGADLLVGHNIIDYDIPVLKKLYPWFNPRCPVEKLHDTLIMSRLRWPEIFMVDKSGKYTIPGKLVGEYSLEAFGWRIGLPNKIEIIEWKNWTPEIQKRCENDVKANTKLYNLMMEKPFSEKALSIENRFQEYLTIQETLGVPFNEVEARKLLTPIAFRKQQIIEHLTSIIPPKEIRLKTKVKHEPFNPGSRDQIIKFFCSKYNWKPEQFTDKGNPKLDEEILESLPYPEAEVFAEYFRVAKLIGMLSEGDKSWLKFVRNGRLHGRVVGIGAITHRCTHSSPNLAQVPSSKSFMGKEVRSLFHAGAGMAMVGTDLSGIELRCLSHYLHRWDNGAYAREVVDGDVHTRNQLLAGLPTRDNAKTFIYCLTYGGGDAKIGQIVLPKGTEYERKIKGRQLRHKFMSGMPAYEQLSKAVKQQVQLNGFLTGIDGRKLTIRQEYSALNTLLQNAGAVAAKLSTVLAYEEAKRKGIEAFPALHVHDEWQSICKPEDAEELGKLNVQAIKNAGEELNFKCPLDGEYKVGKNWADTH